MIRPAEAFAKPHDPKAPLASPKDLLRAVRDIVAGAASGPYQGGFCVAGEYRNMPVDALRRLPAWPVADVNLASRRIGEVLSDEQLPAVREALAKTNTYDVSTPNFNIARRVWLVPHVSEALRLYMNLR